MSVHAKGFELHCDNLCTNLALKPSRGNRTHTFQIHASQVVRKTLHHRFKISVGEMLRRCKCDLCVLMILLGNGTFCYEKKNTGERWCCVYSPHQEDEPHKQDARSAQLIKLYN